MRVCEGEAFVRRDGIVTGCFEMGIRESGVFLLLGFVDLEVAISV